MKAMVFHTGIMTQVNFIDAKNAESFTNEAI